MDDALRASKKRQSRMVSAGIIIAGLLILGAVLLFSGSRRRADQAAQVMVGDDSADVVRLLGQPGHRCQPSSLAHLVSRFPAGMPRPAIDETLNILRPQTSTRWLYPKGAGCVPGEGDTEVGLDATGRVLWIVPDTGNRPIEYAGAPT